MDFDKLLNELKLEIVTEAKTKFGESGQLIVTDMKTYLAGSKEKIIKWFTLYDRGAIDKDELAWLLKSQKDLLTLEALYKAGLNQIKIGHFKNRIIKIVFNRLVGIAI